MATNGNPQAKLTTRQQRGIAALLAEHDAKAAAETAGVGYRTMNRWLTDPAFRAALLEAEGDLLDLATRRLLGLSDRAVTTLGDAMDDDSQSVRLRAAQAVLEYLLKLRELRNIDKRLTDLEAKIYGWK